MLKTRNMDFILVLNPPTLDITSVIELKLMSIITIVSASKILIVKFSESASKLSLSPAM